MEILDRMRKPWRALCLTLFATGLVLTAFGCQHGGGAGSADPHHYTAAEARAAFLEHNRSAGQGGAQARNPNTPAKPSAPQTGTGN